MFHTERDRATFLGEILLLLAAATAVVLVIAVTIALFCKAFRSRRALYTSFVFSSIASIPALLAVVLQWPYLPDEWDKNPTAGILLVVDVMLLVFLWATPVVQYRLHRGSGCGRHGGLPQN